MAPKASFNSIDSIPFLRKDISIDLSDPLVAEVLELEPQYLPFFRPEIVMRWLGKFGAKYVLETIKAFFAVKQRQKEPIRNPEAWMEKAFKKNYMKQNNDCQLNKDFIETLKSDYCLHQIKIAKRYCQNTETGKDYYYHLPIEVFQSELKKLIE